MFDSRGRRMTAEVHEALVGIAEERRHVGLGWLAGQEVRWNAAVHGPVVAEILVRHANSGVVVRLERDLRIDAVALQFEEVAVAARVLEHAVDAEGEVIGHRLTRVDLDPLGIE